VVILEILSPSTEKFDRGTKFQRYRTIPSLTDYILVSQDEVRIEQFTRQPDDNWTLRDHKDPERELRIDSIGVSIPLRQIYDRVGIL
jgi:Uma2 family endonuclease